MYWGLTFENTRNTYKKRNKMKRFLFLATLLVSVFATFKMGLYTFDTGNPFFYMFLHDNIFHLAINLYCAYLLRNMLRFDFFVPAYIVSVVIHIILPQPLPVIGFSSVLFFFTGFLAAYSKRVLFYTIPFLVIGFFCTNIAADFHLCAFIAGISTASIKKLVNKYNDFCRGYKT